MAVSLAVAAVAFGELRRVERGKLFLWALPGERAASDVEVVDARQSAAAYQYPAICAVLAIGVVIAWFGPIAEPSDAAPWSLLVLAVLGMAVLGMAVLADVITTVRFFHTQGVFEELHPAVRLFGYAYGRTVGPVLAKLVQLVGVLAIAFILGRRGWWVIAAATILYFGAAAYNAFFAH